jgi:hypothetical protein
VRTATDDVTEAALGVIALHPDPMAWPRLASRVRRWPTASFV